ncbi:hypothetical protein [Kribbella speibonae]|nr:hypothetical protein [Kribbella speibonae]
MGLTLLLIALIGAALIHLLRPRPTPVLVVVRRDGKLVQLPSDQLTNDA